MVSRCKTGCTSETTTTQNRPVGCVGILDCDQHYSDGTIDILDKLELHDVIQNWTFGDEFGHRSDFRQEAFLERLGDSIDGMKDDGVELVILQAGADPHVNDPLSSAGMTSEEMRGRYRGRLCPKTG